VGGRKKKKFLDRRVIPSFSEDEEDDEDDGEDEEDRNNHNDNDSPHGEARAIGHVQTRSRILNHVTVSRVEFLEVAVTVLDGARVGIVVGKIHSIWRHEVI